jgi:N-acyl homoserine lactone hydrolase
VNQSTITRLDVSEFTFPDDEPYAGQTGVVVAYLIRHPDAIVLFDTGIGLGSSELDARYHPRPRPIGDVLAEQSLQVADINVVVNCHLHADHAGQNVAFPRIPIYVQPAEWQASQQPDYTITEWLGLTTADYRRVAGDHEVLPGVRVIATPGHTAGHQSVVVETAEGSTVLTGQAVYSAGEWTAEPGAREGRSTARDRDAYDASVDKLRALDPVRVWFAHDRETWRRRVWA